MNYTDAELKEAAAIVRKALLESLPDTMEYTPDYSSAFLEKMGRLIVKTKRRVHFIDVASRIVAVILIFLFCSSVWVLSSVDARAFFKAWIREVYEGSFIYRYFVELQNDELKNYDFTELPSGYIEIVNERNDTSHFKMYQKDESIISFMYYKMNDGTVQKVFAAKGEKIIIDENIADIYVSEDGQVYDLVLINEKDGVVFWISSDVEKELLVNLAKSIEERRK